MEIDEYRRNSFEKVTKGRLCRDSWYPDKRDNIHHRELGEARRYFCPGYHVYIIAGLGR